MTLLAFPVVALVASAPAFSPYFEENVGQAPPEVLARAQSGAMRFEVLATGLRIGVPGGGVAFLAFVDHHDRHRARPCE